MHTYKKGTSCNEQQQCKQTQNNMFRFKGDGLYSKLMAAHTTMVAFRAFLEPRRPQAEKFRSFIWNTNSCQDAHMLGIRGQMYRQ